MKQFEYLEYRNISTKKLIEIANEKGQEGWELVYVRGGNNYLFKRELLITNKQNEIHTKK